MDLGSRLRERRAASGRTIAAVAAEAGLSVPYIANLENGRGNPTVAALTRLAEALGMTLVVDLADAEPAATTTPEPTAALLRFARSDRFHTEATRLANATHIDEQVARQRLLGLLTAAQAAVGELSTIDCQRFLDAVALAARDR